MTKARDLADFFANGLVDTNEVSDGAVTTAKLADASVTNAKVASGVAGTKISYDNSVSGISANTMQEAVDYLNALSGGSSGSVASYTRSKFTATAGQTTFAVTYQVGYLEVYLNGVLLDITDYAASDGTSVVLAVGASAGDEIVTIALDSFAIAELLRIFSTSASAPDDSVTVDANGRLGVGTALPASTLHLASSSGPYVTFQDTDAGTNQPSIGTTGTAGSLILNSGSTVGSIIFTLNQGASEVARIDTQGKFLVGKTSASSATEGTIIDNNGIIYSTPTSNPGLNINRLSTDGTLAIFRKDNGTVGQIDSVGGTSLSLTSPDGLRLYDSVDGGIILASGRVYPANASGYTNDGVISFGSSASRFYDGYFSNTLYLGTDGYLEEARIRTATDYRYGTAVSATVNPRLKQHNGDDWVKGRAGFVLLVVNGTSTPDTDQVYYIGYNGSGTNEIRHISTNSPGVSNRPALALDAEGYPYIYTGHSNTYTVVVRVILDD